MVYLPLKWALDAIRDKLPNLTTTASGDSIPVSLPSGESTVALMETSNAGSVGAGAVHVTFSNEGAAAAVVASGSLPAGKSVTFPARLGETLGEITFDATGTTLLISYVMAGNNTISNSNAFLL